MPKTLFCLKHSIRYIDLAGPTVSWNWTELNLNELHQAASDGDSHAEKRLFEILTVRFRRFVYQRVWNEETAEEVAQEALAVVARDYRDLQVHTSFAAWSYRVLENRLLVYFRARRSQLRQNRGALENDEQYTGADQSPDLRIKLLDCIRRITGANRRYARILNLRYQGYKTDEICTRLKISATNCYAMLSRARDSLEHCLEGESTKS